MGKGVTSNDMALSAEEWTKSFAAKLGTVPPTEDELTSLLDLAGTAAHMSERTAAPVSCWLAARAGVAPAEALRVAKQLAEELAS